MSRDGVVCLKESNWFGDTRVRSCTPQERMVWLDILSHMSRSASKGVLTLSLERIALLAGSSIEVLRSLIANGVLQGQDSPEERQGCASRLPFVYRPKHAGKLGEPVTLIDEQAGSIWFCDWMVRDFHRSEKASVGVKAALADRKLPAQLPEPQAGSKIGPAANAKSEDGLIAGGEADDQDEIDRATGRRVPNCPRARLIAMYHELLPVGKKVVMADGSSAIAKSLKSRWRALAVAQEGPYSGYTDVESGLAKWEAIFRMVAASRFLTGQVDGRDGGAPFELSLAWLVGPKNMERVLNGFYHRGSGERQFVAGSQADVKSSSIGSRVSAGVESVLAMQRHRQFSVAVGETAPLPL